MSVKTDRIEARLSAGERERIERAAATAGQSLFELEPEDVHLGTPL